MWNKQRYCWQLPNHVWIENFRQRKWQIAMLGNLSISSWSYDMEGHAKKCVERYCELANRTTQQLYKVSTPCIDDHQFKEEELKSVGECQKYALKLFWKCLHLARIGRPDILWSVNKLARSITKWTKACGKRLSRLISYIHHTCEYTQHCHVGNNADWTVSRLRFCRRSWGFKIYIRWNIVHFWKSYVCSNQLDVQETNFSFAQLNRETCLHLQREWKFLERLMIWIMFIVFLQTRILLARKLCCTSLKTTKQWSKWS